MAVKKNIRIQLFSPEGEIMSDRMVTQLPEFYAGPKEKHNGPLRIEFTFEDQKDAELAIDYIKRITGQLPLKSKGETRGRKASEKDNDTDDDTSNDLSVEIKNMLGNFQEDPGILGQDDLIKQLRDMGFIFVTSDFLGYIIPETYSIKEIHLKKYDWLIKRTKQAVDPKNDKFDPRALIGLRMSDGRDDRIVLYTYGNFDFRYKVPVPEKKAMKASKTNLIKFPHYMNEEERLKWGAEHRALIKDENKRPSKFYMRWFKDVKVGDELSISQEEIEKRHAKEA